MRLIDDWRVVLRRSWAVWLSAAATVLMGIGGALFVFADELGDGLFFALDVGCFALAAVFTAAVPLARITKQKSISGGDDASTSDR